jgi:hypothetical protein
MVRGTQSTGAEELEDNLFPAIGMRVLILLARDLLVPIKVVEATGRLEWLRVFSSALMRLCVMPCKRFDQLQSCSGDGWGSCFK